jgi:hypothetical protein
MTSVSFALHIAPSRFGPSHGGFCCDGSNGFLADPEVRVEEYRICFKAFAAFWTRIISAEVVGLMEVEKARRTSARETQHTESRVVRTMNVFARSFTAARLAPRQLGPRGKLSWPGWRRFGRTNANFDSRTGRLPHIGPAPECGIARQIGAAARVWQICHVVPAQVYPAGLGRQGRAHALRCPDRRAQRHDLPEGPHELPVQTVHCESHMRGRDSFRGTAIDRFCRDPIPNDSRTCVEWITRRVPTDSKLSTIS